MSDPMSEIKAKLLLEELNRRTRWFAILRANRSSAPWGRFIPVLFLLFAMALVWKSFDSGQAGAIFMLTTALCFTMGAYAEDVHRRLDALVELLRQEGMLESTLPASRQGKPGDNAPRQSNGSCLN